MRILIWIGAAWLGMTLFSALGSRLGIAHILPDITIIVVVFLALRREPLSVVGVAFLLGYLTDRAALAPDGLHEMALVMVALGVYVGAGALSNSGTIFFGMVCAAAVMGYQALVFALVLWQKGAAGFASWTTASLIPTAFATFVVALACHRPMLWLDKRLTQDKREGLAWR